MADDKTIIAEPIGLTAFQGPKSKKSCLVQYSGQGLGKRFILEKPELYVGRSPDNEIVANEQSVSRQHARFLQLDDRVDIEDLGTTNGTFVNDRKIEERTKLTDGDLIRLGTILFKFYAHNNIDNVFHDRIYRMATIDVGTQIFNKKYMLESLANEVSFSRTAGKPLSLIYYDLDFFKSVNDNYGHNAGDFILKASAERASKLVRKDDIFGRMGGEEFCIVLPGTPLAVAAELAERVRAALAADPYEYEGLKLSQTISAGVSELNSKMETGLDLIEVADQRLYFCKKNGRNQIKADD